MDIARGGSFGRGDKKAKAKTSTSGEKKKEPQSKINRLTELAKSLYRNDFTRSLIRDTSLFVVAIIGIRLLAGELKAEAIASTPAT